MSKYTAKDAAKDTGSSGKDTSNAWHTARDDADREKGTDRHRDNSGWGSGSSGSSSSGSGDSGSSGGGLLGWLFGK